MRTSIQQKRSTSARQQEPSASVTRIQDTAMPMQPREVAQFQRMQEAQCSPREQRLQVIQRRRDSEGASGNDQRVAQQPRENKTGMPDRMLHNVEAMSGFDMSDVRVHYNSDKPAQLQAHAYAQGNQIYLGPRQEKHLGHEAWHVVQQKQGRVQATRQLKVGDSAGGRRVGVNDDVGLEREADVMGGRAFQANQSGQKNTLHNAKTRRGCISTTTFQLKRRIKNNPVARGSDQQFDFDSGTMGSRPIETEEMKALKINAKTRIIKGSNMLKTPIATIMSKFKAGTRDPDPKKVSEKDILYVLNTSEKTYYKRLTADQKVPIKMTLHHKYPWGKISNDIKHAFTELDPRSGELYPNLILRLVGWAGVKFPTDIDEFGEYPVEEYAANENSIDDWIQNVCWTPHNIFLGPSADLRKDDPAKRTEEVTRSANIDSHWITEERDGIKKRRMSFNSEDAFKTALGGGILDRKGTKWISHGKKINLGNRKDNRKATDYDPSEWEFHKGEYIQKADLYNEWSRAIEKILIESEFFFNFTKIKVELVLTEANKFPITRDKAPSLRPIKDDYLNTCYAIKGNNRVKGKLKTLPGFHPMFSRILEKKKQEASQYKETVEELYNAIKGDELNSQNKVLQAMATFAKEIKLTIIKLKMILG